MGAGIGSGRGARRLRADGRAVFVSLSAVALALACARRDATLAAPSATVDPARAKADAGRGAAEQERVTEREAMVREQIAEGGVNDARVLAAMRRTPRHRFVLPELADEAYADRPLPIVGGQTISQPFIVAFMSQAAGIAPKERCLEIGTGSGYQAAVLAELCSETFSIEYLPEVAAFGRRNLEALGYLQRGVTLRVGDGYAGWPEHAPFDAIIVTAAPEQVPEPLLEQLAMGGRLVIPVGSEGGLQRLERWTRVAPGRGEAAFKREKLLGVQFVPFLGPGVAEENRR